MKEWYTAFELASKALPGLPSSKRGIAKLAAREGWARAPGATRTRNDGAVEYNVAILPERARHVLAGHALQPETVAPAGPATVERDARMAILTLQKSFADALQLSVWSSDPVFAGAYNAGHITADDWVRNAFPTISERSLRNWRKWRDEGSERLSKGRGAGRKKPSVLAIAHDGEVANLISGALVRQPHLNARHVRSLVLAAFGDKLEIMTEDGALLDVPVPQETAFRRYIAGFKEQHRVTLAALTDPDKFKSRYRVSGFSREHVERLNQVWETDASPADVLCVDGRYSIYVLLDVFSRRLIALVSRTPRADAVLLLVRKAILAWGVPELVKTDNGSDFKAHAVRRAFASLHIQHHLCDPFSPEQKGKVERAIGTMQRDLMPLLPGFIGHSVAHRKAIEARKAFAARLGQDDAKAFGVSMTASDLQAALDHWCAKDYGMRAHSALKMSPFAKAQTCHGAAQKVKDERALDLLLAPVPGASGIRTVGKQGLKIDNAFFTAINLLPGEKVLVRHDPADAGRVYCFKADGSEFLCEAICYERIGVNPAEAIAKARAEQNRILTMGKAELRKEARKIKARDMYASLQAVSQKASSTVVPFPKPEAEHSTPQLEAASEAASPRTPPVVDLPPDLLDEHAAAVAEWEAMLAAANGKPKHIFERPRIVPLKRPRKVIETEEIRFLRALDVEGRLTRGEPVEPHWTEWLQGYQTTVEYRASREILSEFGESWLSSVRARAKEQQEEETDE